MNITANITALDSGVLADLGQRLASQAYLYDDQAAYRAGIADAIAAISGAVGSSQSAPVRLVSVG